ncbi:DOMON domain-containing protein FRRS1L-like isoform X2 [Ptychodera flava]|uniref:DOMON domain-containing protein FRRS1L-like isoform X2 n=1 Tax=Ptychodera flava TaxID=63121 RepID=UPI00396A84CA
MESSLQSVCLMICFAVMANGTAINRTGCGTSKACYSDPEHCDPSAEACDFFLSYKENGGNVDFEIVGERTNSEGWIAVAFSYDKKMGTDNGVMCINDGFSTSVKTFYNQGKMNMPGDSNGLSDMSIAANNGIISCSFSRSTSRPNDSKFFDLTMDFYLLMGTGPCSGGRCSQHESLPKASLMKVDFSSTDDINAGDPDHSHSSSSSESHETSDSATIDVSSTFSVLVAVMVLATVIGL